MKKIEFEKKYLNKYVEVNLHDGDKYVGYLYSTNEFMKQTGIADLTNYYFIGNNIRESNTRFKKSHIKNISLLEREEK